MRYVPLDDGLYSRLERVAKLQRKDVKCLLEKIVGEYCRNFERNEFGKLIETFCNGKKALRIKGTPVTVMRGELFVRKGVDYEELKKLAEDHDAKLVEEFSESGNLIGYSIIPNVGFNEKTMEGWLVEEGISLLKKLITIFK